MECFENVYKTICRVCLRSGNSENMVSLLNNASADGLSCYGKAAQIFTNIHISNNFLPSSMCKQCVKLLKQALLFKKISETSQKRIEKLLSLYEFSEHVFQKNLVEYALFTSILCDNTSNIKLSKTKILPEGSKCKKLAQNLVRRHKSSGFDSPRQNCSIKKTATILNSESQELNDLFTDTFQSNTDSSSDEFKERNHSGANCKPSRNTMLVEEPNKNDLMTMKEDLMSPVATSNKVSKDEVDELLDTIEEVIKMDNKTIQMLTPYEKEKSPKKLKIKSEESNKTDANIKIKSEERNKTNANIKIKSEEPNANIKIKSEECNKTDANICKYCNKQYCSKASLKLHMVRHTGLSGFVCEHCARWFATKAEFQYHLNSSHNTGVKFVCDECGHEAFKKYELKVHMRKHSGERPFRCNECGFRFRQKFILNRHMIYHTEKTVSCMMCSKKFHTKFDMKVHMNNIHERRYMYSCDFCDIKYAKICTVRRHIEDKHGIARSAQGKITKINLDDEKEPKRKYRRKWLHTVGVKSDD